MELAIVPTYAWRWWFNVIVAMIILSSFNEVHWNKVLLHGNMVKYFFSPVTKMKLVFYFYFI